MALNIAVSLYRAVTSFGNKLDCLGVHIGPFGPAAWIDANNFQNWKNGKIHCWRIFVSQCFVRIFFFLFPSAPHPFRSFAYILTMASRFVFLWDFSVWECVSLSLYVFIECFLWPIFFCLFCPSMFCFFKILFYCYHLRGLFVSYWERETKGMGFADWGIGEILGSVVGRKNVSNILYQNIFSIKIENK